MIEKMKSKIHILNTLLLVMMTLTLLAVENICDYIGCDKIAVGYFTVGYFLYVFMVGNIILYTLILLTKLKNNNEFFKYFVIKEEYFNFCLLIYKVSLTIVVIDSIIRLILLRDYNYDNINRLLINTLTSNVFAISYMFITWLFNKDKGENNNGN